MITETKLHIPQTRGKLIARPHLFRRLDEGLDCAMTLVTAPAGYGKSTLLSEWSATIRTPTAWVSIDRYDNHALRFWTHTLTAIHRANPSFDIRSIPTYAGEDLAGDALISTFINRLYRLSIPFVLVWDDFHLVEDPGILKGVAYFLERLPSHVHVYITSRTLPNLPISRLRVNGRLHELGTEDLRFGMEETQQFFECCANLVLSADECTTLLTQTEGWVAGMHVAALSTTNDVDPRDRIATILAMTGRHRNFADYFFEEVFMKQSEERQRFLLMTSILEQMTPELCEAITHMPNGANTLQQLEEDHLFLSSLDHERNISRRFVRTANYRLLFYRGFRNVNSINRSVLSEISRWWRSR